MTKNLVVVSWSGQSDRLILISAKNLYTQGRPHITKINFFQALPK